MSSETARWTPSASVLADVQLLLDGAYAPLTGFPGAATLAGLRADGRLADGTPFPRPVALPAAQPVAVGDTVELADAEGTPVAAVDVRETFTDPVDGRDLLAGPVRPLRRFEHGTFAARHRGPAAVRAELAGAPVVAMLVDRPLLSADIAALSGQAESLGAGLLLLVPAGLDQRLLPFEALVRATDAARIGLRARTVTEVLPMPAGAGGDLHAYVAARYGATHLLSASAGGGGALPVLPLADPAPGLARLYRLIDEGREVDLELAPDAVVAEVARTRRPRAHRGLVVLLTGLSGSGKSTLARALYDRLAERGERTITYLDGDVVRQMLSAGLSFSRADRELNVRRIGYVAAEAARHGGLALCAPIAPYAAMRAEMRERAEQVGDFLLVHVSTPLAVCEQRDRKGLYALARAGKIPEFTGISDPYDTPTDADLTLDTSQVSLDDGVQALLALLIDRGYLPVMTCKDA